MRANSFITKETALLESMMAGTDKDTRRYLKNMHESFVVPYTAYLNKLSRRIDEAQLTQDQISQLFGAIAGPQGAVGGTVLPDSVKQKFDAALPPADAGEVQGFEQKAAQAAAQVQDPQAKQGIMNLIKQGLQNPVAQKLILTGISGLAGVAASAVTGGLGGALGAGAAGALTGGLMGVITAKMQGADWKTAGKAGLKGAAMGGAAGLVGGGIAQAGAAALGAYQSHQATHSPSIADQEASGTLPADQMARDAGATVTRNPDGTPLTLDQIDANRAFHSAADRADGAALAASGNSTNPDGTASPEMSRYMDAQAAAATASDKLGAANAAAQRGSKFTSQDSDAEDFSGTATPQQQQAADDAIYKQAKDAGATGSTSSEKFTGAGAKDQAFSKVQATNLGPNFDPSKVPDGWTMKTGAAPVDTDSSSAANSDTGSTDQPYPSAGKVRANLDKWRTDTGSPNAPKADTGSTDTGSTDQPYPSAGKVRANLDKWRTATGSPNAPQAANLTPDFDPSKVPDGWTIKTGAAPVDADTSGPTAGGVPVGSTPAGINRLTGKPISSGPSWDEMTPDQQAATQAKQQQQRQDAEQGTQNARDYWKNKSSNTRSLKSSKQPTRPMLETVDRDLTIRMWALNESLGKKRGGVQITEAGISDVIGKITNFFKGGGASKGKSVEDLQTAWQRAGSPMDSEQLAEFLKKQGIADDIIASAYKQVGIPAPGEKVEPTMGAEPTAPAQPEQPAAQQQAEPTAPAAQPEQPAAQPEAPAQAEPAQSAQPEQPAAAAGGDQAAAAQQQQGQQAASTGTVFDNPDQLAKDFEEYMAAGGKISPQFRGAIKAALQTGFKVVESKQRKLLKVLKEARRIDAELKKIKKKRL